jgi:hypothetical protein
MPANCCAACATKNGTSSSNRSNTSMNQHYSQEDAGSGDEPTMTFRRMDDRINELVKNPLIADDVRRYAAEREHVTRVYAQELAEIKRAERLTDPERVARVAALLDRMHNDIWPLLRDHEPVSKQDREQALGYDPETGV